MDVRQTAQDVHAKFEREWGGFRRYIAAHPLTGFWIGVAGGAVLIGWGVGRLHFPF